MSTATLQDQSALETGVFEASAQYGQPEPWKQEEPVRYISPPHSLSQRLKKAGEQLSDAEACIVDTAQTLAKKFRNGHTVPSRALGRVVMQYHRGIRGLQSYEDLREAFVSLERLGICRMEGQKDGEHLRLIKWIDRKPQPTRFARITDDRQDEEILLACRNCAGDGFETCQNVASRCAVKSLMMARHGISSNQFKERLKRLIVGEILEEIPGKGSTALRLTASATLAMKGLDAEPKRGIGRWLEALMG